MSSHEEVILVISSTNEPNITFQKEFGSSTLLQVHLIGIYLAVRGILNTKRHFSVSVQGRKRTGP